MIYANNAQQEQSWKWCWCYWNDEGEILYSSRIFNSEKEAYVALSGYKLARQGLL
jgi:hypothetical protein